MMDDWTWRKAKAQWLKHDEAGRTALEEKLLALACVEVDLENDDEIATRHVCTLNARQRLLDDVAQIQSNCSGRTGRHIVNWARSVPSKYKGFKQHPA